MSYGGEIASAFVRIRPNLGGFKSEATSGVRSSLRAMQEEVNVAARANVNAAVNQIRANKELAASYRRIGSQAAAGSTEAKAAARLAAEATAQANMMIGRSAVAAEGHVRRLRERLLNLGTVLGVGFGAMETVKFVKEITGAAAQVQKSIEVIKATFGRDASEVIVRFGDTVASKLGISAALADATSARFGILFKNLGLGQSTSAMMTVNLEKLAGALGAIKGVDPSLALGQLDRAMLGNIRGLKSLGLSVDPALEKIAAFKLGLISSVKDALTPGVRAQAIYALATAHLGDYLQLAKKHAGDAANQQRRLSAEWANAKDALGTALLPVFTKYVTKIADWLGAMLKSGKLQRDINNDLKAAGQVFRTLGGAIHIAIVPLQLLKSLAGSTGGAIKILLAAFAVSKILGFANAIRVKLIAQGIMAIGPAAIAAQEETTVAFAGIGVSAEAMSATVKGALISTGIGALAVAAGIAAYEIIQHWGTVKRWFSQFVTWIRPELDKIRAAIQAFTSFASRVWRDWGSTIVAVARNEWNFVKGTVQNALTVLRGILDVFKGLFTGDWSRLWKGLKEIARGGLSEAKLVVITWGKDILAIFGGIWKNVEKLALEGLSKFTELMAKIPTSFKVFGHKVGFTNPFKGITQDLKDQIAGIDAAAAAKDFADATARDTAAALAARTRDPTLVNTANGLGKAIGGNVKKGLKTSLTGTGGDGGGGGGGQGGAVGDAISNSIFNQGVKDAISAAKKRLADAISSGNQAIASAQQSLANYILAGQKRITAVVNAGNAAVSKAAVAAGANLDTIGKKLTDTIGKYLSSGADAAALAKGPLGQQFQRLKAALLSGHGGPELINAAQELASQLQSSQAASGPTAKKKADITRHVSDLVDELNKHLISVKAFHTRVEAYLAAQGITYAKIGKGLGRAQGDAYLAEIDALFKQAGIIGAEPKALRDIVKKNAGAATAGVKIIDPNAIRAAADRKAAATRTEYHRGVQQRIDAVGKAERGAQARAAAAREAERHTVSREALKIQQHILAEQKKTAKATAKAAKAAKATATTNAQIASTTVNSTGFPSATTKNPGVSASRARAGAAGGLNP